MQHAVSARTPAHLWIVGILSLIWNCFGAYDYLMTNLKNEAYLAHFGADQLAYLNGLPAWLTAFWALGVWGGVAGSLLLLIRSRYAVWAFAVSLLGAIIAMGYERFMTQMPASMSAGMMSIMPWVVLVVAALLLWYGWNLEKRGLIR